MSTQSKTTVSVTQDAGQDRVTLTQAPPETTSSANVSNSTGSVSMNLYTKPGAVPPIKFEVNEFGLFSHVKYHFTPDGYVDWKKMIPAEFLYVNPRYEKKVEEIYKKPLSEINVVEDGVEDKYLAVLLGGLKYVANLRRFSCVSYHISTATPDYVGVSCQIDWCENYETNNSVVYFTSLAGASLQNTAGFTKNYLIETAENRAFCRCVRNSLRINIVSKEELSDAAVENAFPASATSGGPSNDMLFAGLEREMQKADMTFAEMVKKIQAAPDLSKTFPDAAAWKSCSDIPSDKIHILLERLRAKNASKKK